MIMKRKNIGRMISTLFSVSLVVGIFLIQRFNEQGLDVSWWAGILTVGLVGYLVYAQYRRAGRGDEKSGSGNA